MSDKSVAPASQLPWKVSPTEVRKGRTEAAFNQVVIDAEYGFVSDCGGSIRAPQDAEYLVHAANFLPALIAQRGVLLAALKAALPWVAISICGDKAFGIENPQRAKNHAEDMALIQSAIQTVEATSHEG
jgi:hypothetical protein